MGPCDKRPLGSLSEKEEQRKKERETKDFCVGSSFIIQMAVRGFRCFREVRERELRSNCWPQ